MTLVLGQDGVSRLLDGGRPVATVVVDRAGDLPRAEPLRRLTGADPAAVAALAARDLPGVRVATDDEVLAEHLGRAGAVAVRQAHLYEAEPGGPAPSVPPGLRLGAVEGAQPLARAWLAAYPQGHPDRSGVVDAAAELAGLLSGAVLGPLLPEASASLLDEGGRSQGAILVHRVRADAVWAGGAWISEVFVAPPFQGRGAGTALLRRALRGAVGEPRVGLAVTVGNPAVRRYEAVGFRRHSTSWAFTMPAQ